MTDAERQERREAGQEADAALERAEEIKSRGTRIAQGWIRSRKDNNFRLMLRNLGQEVAGNGT